MEVRYLGALTSTDKDEAYNKVIKKIYRSVKLGSPRMLTKIWLRKLAEHL